MDRSKDRHPAGRLRKVAERSPHDLSWALNKAKELGAKEERERIIEELKKIK